MGSFVFTLSQNSYAMHIAEGFLPMFWAFIWYALFIPFFALSALHLSKTFRQDSSKKVVYALMGAFAFTLSALKIPSIVGSCSHPTGMGLGSILIGPMPMVAIGTIVLLLQALLIAHGGITTLGANAFSMAVVGPFLSYGSYMIFKRFGLDKKISIFLAAIIGNLGTYWITSIQLGIAFGEGALVGTIVKFMGVFMLTQVPIAVAEGLLSVVVYNLLTQSDIVKHKLEV